MKAKLNTIYNVDARRISEVFPEGLTIQTTISSPPYYDMKDYGEDNQIGFGQSYEEYLQDIKSVFEQVYSHTKDDGTLWIIIDTFKRNNSIVLLPFDVASKLQETGWLPIPSRDSLTYTNGYYVNCTALFVDICDSSKLPEYQNRPVLAKIYRSFISELVALFNGAPKCKEVNINGDCVWAVFDTPYKEDIDNVYSTACQANALVDILNYKLDKKGYKTYKVGIGIDYGRALMIKAGNKGSSINDVVWMGDVVNQSCHLAAKGNSLYSQRNPIMLSSAIYNNLNEQNQGLCSYNNSYFQSDAINIEMNNWLKEQRSKDNKSNGKYGFWGNNVIFE